jgi:uncharacterized protein
VVLSDANRRREPKPRTRTDDAKRRREPKGEHHAPRTAPAAIQDAPGGAAGATFPVPDGAGVVLRGVKVAYEGAPETGLDVFRHSLDDVLDEPLIRQRQSGADGLGPTCGRCPLVAVCGGGLFAHRYAAGSGFRNPSVYCADLAALILHVRARVRADLAEPPQGLPELDVRGT